MILPLLNCVQSLLDEPNPNSPANSTAAQLYQENRREYEKRVQQIVEQSWLNFAENDGQPEEKSGQQSGADADTAAAAAAPGSAAFVPAEDQLHQSEASSSAMDASTSHNQ